MLLKYMDNKGNYNALTWIAVQTMHGAQAFGHRPLTTGNRIRSQTN